MFLTHLREFSKDATTHADKLRCSHDIELLRVHEDFFDSLEIIEALVERHMDVLVEPSSLYARFEDIEIRVTRSIFTVNNIPYNIFEHDIDEIMAGLLWTKLKDVSIE